MSIKRYFCGNEMGRMPNLAYKMMSFLFSVRDFFFPATFNKKIEALPIQKGMSIIDFGCGPGRYLQAASEAVGEKGRIYAVDIHELALKDVAGRMSREGLTNVVPVLAQSYPLQLEENVADLIYAFDMFHMIKDPTAFLCELHRLLRQEGLLFIEDGHQPRSAAKHKINQAGCWTVIEETKAYLKCIPKEV